MNSSYRKKHFPRLLGPLGLAILALSLAGYGQIAFAQAGYRVKPLRLHTSGRAGATMKPEVQVRNTSRTDDKTVLLSLLPLRQGENGDWHIVEGREPEEPYGASCKDWTKLSDTEVKIPPAATRPVEVTVDIPPDASGTYFIGILAEEKPPETDAAVQMVLRFLVPVSVKVTGRPVRQDIELTDLRMAYEETEEEKRAVVYAGIDNKGRSHSVLEGQVKVSARAGDRWRPVGQLQIERMGILPLTTLDLPLPLDRELPEGRYKLDATVFIDGRRIKPLTREVEFEGVPGVTTLPVDATLRLTPNPIELAVRPGAVRATALTIENASEDSVKLSASVKPPAHVKKPSRPDQPGVMAMPGWLRVLPAELDLRGSSRRNIRVAVRVPDGLPPASHRYVELVVDAKYPEGQPAGNGSALLVLRDPAVDPQRSLAVSGLELSRSEEGKYILRATLANTGTVHLEPAVAGYVLTPSGELKAEFELQGAGGLLLPTARAFHAGEIDPGALEPGGYELQVRTSVDSEVLSTGRALLKVEKNDEGVRRLSIVQPEEDAEADHED